MIPWYPKQILLHCEEAEKFILKPILKADRAAGIVRRSTLLFFTRGNQIAPSNNLIFA